MPEENSSKALDFRTWKFEWLFFVFGALLILLGVSNGFELPWLKGLTADEHFRWASVAIGSLSLVAGTVIHYRPPSAESIAAPRSRQIPKLDKSGFNEMLQGKYTSQHQREILAIVFEGVSGGDRCIGHDEIYTAVRAKSKYLEQASYSEIYYRLEQLFLLGFLEKLEVGGKNFYRLSSEYAKYTRM